MSPRAWKILSAVALGLQTAPAFAQTGVEREAMAAGPWHHLPRPVTGLQFNRDLAKCKLIALQTPVNSDTPAVVGFLRDTAQINCMKAEGYEPGAGAPGKSAASGSTVTGAKIAALNCGQFMELRKTVPGDAADFLFFAWAQGYITAWNVAVEKPILRVDVKAMPAESQQKFLQNYCGTNPSKLFMEAVTALMAKLKYEKTTATGNPEEPD